ncbi:unnamed protein product [Closterium sp. NIES-65]|nr:unnamed protein product [Closterium sp. NIES-65]
MSGYSGHILPRRRKDTASNTDSNRNVNVNVNIDDDDDDEDGVVTARPVLRRGANRGGSADLAPSAEAQLVAAAADMLRGLGGAAQQTGGIGGSGNLHRAASPRGIPPAGKRSPLSNSSFSPHAPHAPRSPSPLGAPASSPFRRRRARFPSPSASPHAGMPSPSASPHARMPSPSASLRAPPASPRTFAPPASPNALPRSSSPHAPPSASPRALVSSPSASPSRQRKPVPAIFSRPPPLTTPPDQPATAFPLLASSPAQSPTFPCSIPSTSFPSAPSPTRPHMSPSKPPRSPTRSPALSPSSSRRSPRASPLPRSQSSFQNPFPSPKPSHARHQSLDLSKHSPSSLPHQKFASHTDGMGTGHDHQQHHRSAADSTPESDTTDLYPPAHNLIPPYLPNSTIPFGATTTPENNPPANDPFHATYPPSSPSHPLIAPPGQIVAGMGMGMEQIEGVFEWSQSADFEGRVAVNVTGERVRARRVTRRNSVDAGMLGGRASSGSAAELGMRMGGQERGSKSPIKSCLSPANGVGGTKLKKQVSFNRVVRVRRFPSCDASIGQ